MDPPFSIPQRDCPADGDEVAVGTDPNQADTDGDGLNDGVELDVTRTDPTRADTDGDGLTDGVEMNSGSDPLDPDDPPTDTDHDGLTDEEEAILGTDPTEPDTDFDGINDGDELNEGSDPLDINDPSDQGDVPPLPVPSGAAEFVLQGGWNTMVYTGEDGGDPARLAADLGSLDSLWAFDVDQQGWLVYRPGPLGALTNTLSTIDQGTFLFLRLNVSGTVHVIQADHIQPNPTQTAQLVPGWSVMGYTGADGVNIATLLTGTNGFVDGAYRFDAGA